MRSTFKLLFYVNRQKTKADGACPIMGRITLDGKVCQYSTGEQINPVLWDATAGRVIIKGKSSEHFQQLKEINSRLDELELRARLAYKKHTDTTGYVTAELIRNAVTGRTQAKETLLTLFDEHNREYEKRVGIDRSKHSFTIYQIVYKHIQNFLQYKYGVEDIPLNMLDMQFIDDFNFYLSTVLKYKVSTIHEYLIVLRKLAQLAVTQRTIRRYPFAGHKLQKQHTVHRHLTSEQLHKVMSTEMPTRFICHTRDMFVFAVFTGLGRTDLANLSFENIIIKEDGSQWLHFRRQKTKTECNIKLLDIPIRIINKYKGEAEGNKIFRVPTVAAIARNLREIRDISKLDCPLTFYMARHTFATETCLSNGVPIETISKMLGHTSIRTTQIYAEITNQKVGLDFKTLRQKTTDLYSLPKDNVSLCRSNSGR